MIPIEYASAARLERRAEISAAQRQQLLWLTDQVIDYGIECLTRAEYATLVKLQRLQGVISDTATEPLIPQRPPHRSASHYQRQMELMAMRWPRPGVNGRQALLELLRMKGEWSMTRRQAEVNRMRAT